MNIIDNINKKLSFDKDEICAGGESDIEEIDVVKHFWFFPKLVDFSL